ncbi:MAG: MFS transporter, partial [Spirochaetaceae bacterium]|nr:MFS transporter [Spirochaetaceae bacterium]
MITTLVELRGNPRACVYTEPLWGLSMNLCLPYASVYMLALGLKDADVGFIASAGMLTQVIFGFLGGVITDKLGRRKTTAIFDFIAWSIPCL